MFVEPCLSLRRCCWRKDIKAKIDCLGCGEFISRHRRRLRRERRIASLKQSYRPAIALARARAYCSSNSPRARARICCDITPGRALNRTARKSPAQWTSGAAKSPRPGASVRLAKADSRCKAKPAFAEPPVYRATSRPANDSLTWIDPPSFGTIIRSPAPGKTERGFFLAPFLGERSQTDRSIAAAETTFTTAIKPTAAPISGNGRLSRKRSGPARWRETLLMKSDIGVASHLAPETASQCVSSGKAYVRRRTSSAGNLDRASVMSRRGPVRFHLVSRAVGIALPGPSRRGFFVFAGAKSVRNTQSVSNLSNRKR